MSRLTLDEHALILSALWKNPEKYKRRIKVTEHGHGYISVGFDRTDHEVLAQVKQDIESGTLQIGNGSKHE